MSKPPPQEAIYVLVIGDRPVLAFQAVNYREASSLPRETWLLDDLMEARSSGAPLWDRIAKLSVRRATSEETALFLETKKADSDDLTLVYLVELDD